MHRGRGGQAREFTWSPVSPWPWQHPCRHLSCTAAMPGAPSSPCVPRRSLWLLAQRPPDRAAGVWKVWRPGRVRHVLRHGARELGAPEIRGEDMVTVVCGGKGGVCAGGSGEGDGGCWRGVRPRVERSCGGFRLWDAESSTPPRTRPVPPTLRQSKYGSQRALLRNGDQIAPGLLVGVKGVDAVQQCALEGGAAWARDGAQGMAPLPLPRRTAPATLRALGPGSGSVLPLPQRSTWSKFSEFVMGW